MFCTFVKKKVRFSFQQSREKQPKMRWEEEKVVMMLRKLRKDLWEYLISLDL